MEATWEMSIIFDVLIVGAGPAGALAAERLAGSGVKVCLFDGRPAGEPKACGGGVTSKALKRYPHLLHAAGRTINEVSLYSPTGRTACLHLDEPFAVFSRTELDAYLCARAAQAGAQIVTGRAKLSAQAERQATGEWMLRIEDGSLWRGRCLVAADGANSALARTLTGTLPNAEMEVAFGYRAPLSASDLAPTVVAFLAGWQGYAWAFPRLDHISFGIATSQDGFDHRALDDLLWRFMTTYYRALEEQNARVWRNWHVNQRPECVAANQAEAKLRECAQRYAARIPCASAETWRTRRVAGKNWALLGDAAGFADAVTGEGIYYALRSGELFAEAYIANSVASYEERWRTDFGAELIRAAGMRRRFYGEFVGSLFTERMIQVAQKHRGVKRTLGELISGEQGYVTLKSTLLRRAMQW